MTTTPRRAAVALAAVLATAVVGPAGQALAADFTSTRLSGTDRYATAAAISGNAYPTAGVPVVYVATGTGFADALAGGPAAAKAGGPVLPVATDNIPAPIAAELDRLDPARIVVLGGTAAVSDTVLARLRTYTAGAVVRVAGANRYDTAAQVATGPTSPFTTTGKTVFVATGAGFADALAGGAAAARADAPMLLTEPGRLPAATADALRALKPAQIFILGGNGAVNGAVQSELAKFARTDRLAGASRYATAAAISSNAYPTGSPVAYLATGLNFPDALAGTPAAARAAAPLLLTERDCLSVAAADEITRLGATRVVVLGGTAGVSDAAATGTPCAAAAPSGKATVVGTLTDQAGQPIAGATMALSDSANTFKVYEAVSGRDGTYTFIDVDPRTWTLDWTPPRGITATSNPRETAKVAVPSTGTVTANLQVQAARDGTAVGTAMVAGLVTDTAGAAVPGARLRLIRLNAAGAVEVLLTADAAGRYTSARDLAAGDYNLQVAQTAGYSFGPGGSRNFTLTPGQSLTVDMDRAFSKNA